MGLVDLLLLTDGRAPVGAYAHSYGLEVAVAASDVTDVRSLHAFVAARVVTTGVVDAAFAAAVHVRAHRDDLDDVLVTADVEYAARTPAPALRDASCQLGRYLLRLGRRVWPDPRLDALASRTGPGPHHAVVLGLVSAAAGADIAATATASVYGLASGIASAGVRLLGLDPVEVHAVQARLAPDLASVAERAVAAATRPFEDLPATGTPLLDIRAQQHADAPAGHLFAS